MVSTKELDDRISDFVGRRNRAIDNSVQNLVNTKDRDGLAEMLLTDMARTREQ